MPGKFSRIFLWQQSDSPGDQTTGRRSRAVKKRARNPLRFLTNQLGAWQTHLTLGPGNVLNRKGRRLPLLLVFWTHAKIQKQGVSIASYPSRISDPLAAS